MSRRPRSRAAAIEAKRAFAWTSPTVHDCGPEDDTDDEGGIDADCLACDGTGLEWDDTTCAACGGRCTLESPGYDD